MSEIAFISTGDADKDQKIGERFALHESRMQENVCPNGCAQMVWDDAHNRHCPTCGFAGFSTKLFDMKAATA